MFRDSVRTSTNLFVWEWGSKLRAKKSHVRSIQRVVLVALTMLSLVIWVLIRGR